MATHKGILKQVDGLTFVGKTDSNFWVPIDAAESVGGSDAGIRPKEMLLLSLAGCTAMDVASILKKKRVQLDDFNIEISADMTDEHPKVYTKINLDYIFYGKDIKEKDVERAIELSLTKYCGVTAMLEKALTIEHTFRIEEK